MLPLPSCAIVSLDLVSAVSINVTLQYDTEDAPSPVQAPASAVPVEQSSQLAQKPKPKPQEAIAQYHPLFGKGTPLVTRSRLQPPIERFMLM